MLTENRNISNPLFGSNTQDILDGGNDHDILLGNAGNDILSGGSHDDRLHGNRGDDTLSGGSHDDQLHGDSGNDILSGGSHDDQLHGGSGEDFLRGGSHNDLLYGDSGNDTLSGGFGQDTMTGGNGADNFMFDSLDQFTEVITDFDGSEGDKIIFDSSATNIFSVRDLVVNIGSSDEAHPHSALETSLYFGDEKIIELDGSINFQVEHFEFI